MHSIEDIESVEWVNCMVERKEAMFYEKQQSGRVHCFLCPHNCNIPLDGMGICGVRKNTAGTLYSLNYEQVSSLAIDPIEKKPLRNFHPGSYILSVGSFGCNFKCPFCQNHSIARICGDEVDTTRIKSADLVAKAIDLKSQGNIGIAYTYNEPSIWYEYVYETAKLAKEEGLLNVLVTNGYISPKPLAQILPYIDAMNIDLKGFTEGFYKEIVKGGLQEVKATIEQSAKKCHVEITTLVIPGLNDCKDEITEMSKWLSTISPDLPLHLSRYFPKYEMTDKPPTSVQTLTELESTARKYLNYVYLGNV